MAPTLAICPCGHSISVLAGDFAAEMLIAGWAIVNGRWECPCRWDRAHVHQLADGGDTPDNSVRVICEADGCPGLDWSKVEPARLRHAIEDSFVVARLRARRRD